MESISKFECNLVNEWKEYTIQDIGTVVTGSTPPKKDPENYGGELVWIKPPDLDKKKFVNNSEDTISDIGKKKARLLPKGSVLVSCIGNIGKIAIADCELCTNQQINSIIPNNNVVDSVFLFYAIKRMKPYLENIASSAVVPLLNKNDFSKVKIKLPSLETQKKIVKILDKAEKLKEWRAEADEVADEYLKSLFIDMFGDPINNPNGYPLLKLKETIEIKGRVGWRGYKKTDLRKSGPFVLGATHINKLGNIDLSDPVYISREKFEESPEIVLSKNDLVFVQRGNTIGKIGLLNSDIGDATINPCVLIFRPKNLINGKFLLHLLKNHKMKKKIGLLNTSSAQPMITQKDIGNFDVIIPPITLQNQFAKQVKQIETVKNYQLQSKQEIDNLFNILLQNAFKGELIC